MFKTKGLVLGLAAMVMLAGCGTQTAGTSTSNKENTSKEVAGSLSFYTSQPDEDASALVKAFNTKYPNVKVQTFRSGTEEVISKLKAEKQAGNVQADVLLLADSVTFESLKKESMLESYKSPETSQIPQPLVDPDGMYTGTKVMATALAVNTQKVKTIPTSWKVLTDASTKGQGIMPSPLYSGAAAYNVGVLTRTSDFGWDFYKNLKTNEMTVTKGNGGVLQAVADGSKPYGMVVDFMVARAKAKGSPVELVYPSEGVPVITEPIGIIKNAKNADEAKAFVDFVLSEEGQKVAANLGYTPIRKGMQAPNGLKSIDQIKVLDGNIQTLLAERDADKKEFGNVFAK